ncbi:MAG: chemotaxis protein CheB [Chthoniobacter sp.]|nr:chemotaxis protein CheB [Chthoniobacter sp.]
MKKPQRRTSKSKAPAAVEKVKPPKTLPIAGPAGGGEVCPVVGVGASAGGLEAFAQLLEHLPARTGLAFALVQHLDPTRESHLSDILSRSTGMPVVEAKDGVVLEPDHVYVIPPNASMSVSDGTLTLAAREEGRGGHLPIDHFFESLAEHRGNKAIGVVLSGNASDGTLGLKAIKAAGGIAFAQEEASAKFPGMPRSAINAGVVDYVLPLDKMATELARLGGAPYLRATGEDVIEAPGRDGVRKVFKLLRTVTGVDFASYRQTTIQRRIHRRLTVQRMNALEEYLKVLEKDPEEVRALFDDILIHVTNFFREPESFAALDAKVFPELLKNLHPDEPIRIWVPGCSTGEEAYSLAIRLMEFLADKPKRAPIQIFGTDVSEHVIEAARRGIYDTTIEADVSPEQLRRYFVKTDRGYQVSKGIRELCVFARQDLIKDPPFSKLDLISCRNVLIYFEPVLQKKLIPVFHYALKPQGYLLLGSAETVGSFTDLFTPLDTKSKIFLKRANSGSMLPHLSLRGDFSAMQKDPGERRDKTAPEVWSRLDILKEADRLITARYCPPGLVVNEQMEIIQFRGEVAPFLNPDSGEASLNLFKMTPPALGAELRNAIATARKGTAQARKHVLHLELRGKSRETSLEVLRIDPPAVKERAFVIVFEEASEPATPALAPKGKRQENARQLQLVEELAAAREQLQSLSEEHEATNEELRSANEEIQSSNEELQSTNEELETAKEELQSTNEELTTLNEELRHNNRHLTSVNDDINNLLRSVSLPVVMLGRDLRIRRFTPSAKKIFKLIPSDVGRAISDIKADIEVPDLEKLVEEVIDGLSVKERELRDRQGRWYQLQVRPYETADNKIAGAVLILFDIDDARRAKERLKHAARYADALIETVREPLLVLDDALWVKRVTESFCEKFRVSAEDTEGHLFYELGNRQWDIPSLRSLLEEVLPKNVSVTGFKVQHHFPKIGERTVLLNARRVAPVDGEEALIVLSITDAPP